MHELTTFIANHPSLWLAAVVLFVLITIVEMIRNKKNVLILNSVQAVQLINHENASVIDIRSAESFRKGHIIDALSLPAADLLQSPKKIEKLRTRPLLLVCQNGQESQKLANSLLKQGYNTYYLGSGMRAWIEADLPLMKD